MKIDWSNSKTGQSELWKNPLIPIEERLLIADGAIAFNREVISNLRNQIKELKDKGVVAK
ncbi:hypothetical protein D3C85_517070 [compost metagenome]